MVRIFQKKVQYEGKTFDSKEEVTYYRLIKDDRTISCIHTQVRFNVIKAVYMMVPKQLKTKVKHVQRLLIGGHDYTSDFVYFEGNRLVICDVKSAYTSKLREFRITEKAFIARVIEHNRQRNNGQREIVFRVAIHDKGRWVTKDYPPLGVELI